MFAVIRLGMLAAVFRCFCVTGFSDERETLNLADCLDRYLVNFHHAQANTAVLGHASIVGTEGPNLTNDTDWIEITGAAAGKDRRKYSEARCIYPFGANADVWERRFESGEELYRSVGDYTVKMRKVKPVVFDEKKQRLTGTMRNIKFPVVHSMALVASTNSGINDSVTDIERFLGTVKVLEEAETVHGIRGFFYGKACGIEAEFDKRFSWCPTIVKGFYRENADRGGVPDKDDFKKKWFEIATQWEPIAGSDQFVPVRIVNRVFRVNRNSNNGWEMVLDATWREAKPELSLLDDIEIEMAPAGGKIAEFRKVMQRDLDSRLER